jgi:mannobiose 2-epimerase
MRRLRLRLFRFVLLLVLTGVSSSLAAGAAESAAAPGAAELQRQAARCRDLLKRTVLDFYLPGAVDGQLGGYLEDWKDGKFVRRGEKFLTLQARQLWFFSTLATERIERTRCLEAAVIGARLLDVAFRDAKYGGYISRIQDGGQPADTRKHAYLNSFALYGLVAYYEATRDGAALRRAKELFQQLDRHAHDDANGGYHEFFQRDWTPVTDPTERGYVGAIGTKTYNTHLHLLESFAALYRVWPDPGVRARLEELVHINTTTVQHTVHRCNIDGWRPDWRMVEEPRNLRASYGHDVECLWLVLDAARTLGRPEALYRGWAISLGDYSLRHGFDTEHGGFFYTGPLGEGADDTKKEWWVQTEALVGMLDLYRLTGDVRYYQAFARTLDFIERHQIASDGGWWATRNADGSASGNDSRSSMWQGAYHNGRALLLSAKLLTNLGSRKN